MRSLETAILRTLIYADVFHFPLTTAEIHHFLIHDDPVSLELIEATLEHSPALQALLVMDEPYIALRDGLIEQRRCRDKESSRQWPRAIRYGAWLGRLPFVRMVALTGALAMRNAADDDDDFDYIIVTSQHRVWLARAFAILVVRLVKLRGVVICPNYVVAENALEQQRKDLFIAHEIAQMIPIYGHALYWQFRDINQWTEAHLPNAQSPFYTEFDRAEAGFWEGLKSLGERLLGGRLGDWLEQWEYQRKAERFRREMQRPDSAAQIDRDNVKGHFKDYGHPALAKYQERLSLYNVETEPISFQ